MFRTIQIGSLPIQTPGLIIILALWLGVSLAEKFASRRNFPADAIYNLVFTSLVTGVLGARFGFAAQNLSFFTKDPASLISLNPGLLDAWSGMAFALLAGLYYARRKQLKFWDTLDALTPLFAVMAVGISASHLAAGTAFGKETSLPWGIELWGARRHPTQVYMMVASLATLILLSPKLATPPCIGILFLRFAAATAGWVLLTESFRGDSLILLSGIRATQIAAWLILALAFYGLDTLHQKA